MTLRPYPEQVISRWILVKLLIFTRKKCSAKDFSAKQACFSQKRKIIFGLGLKTATHHAKRNWVNTTYREKKM